MQDTGQNSKIDISEGERLCVDAIAGVWRAMDLKSPLWSTAGSAIYDRFEARVRSCSREETLSKFVSRLSRRCHVQVPGLTPEALQAIMAASSDAQAEALRFASEQSGMAVAILRIENKQRREAYESDPATTTAKTKKTRKRNTDGKE